MAISDSQKTDLLWKKVVFGVASTSTNGKQGFEETIGSNVAIFSKDILAQDIPIPAPNASGDVVQYYPKTAALRMTVDSTVAGNRTWIATSTYGNLTTRIGNFVPPSVDAGYLVEVYKNDANVPANKLLAGTNNNEWVFDYQAGVLTFLNTVPAGITSLHIVVHRYVGKTGISGAGVKITEKAVTYAGATLTDGSYTFVGFFANQPQAGTVTASFNGVRMEAGQWSVSGVDLVIDLNSLPFALEADDIVSAQYAWAE